jgi:heavy metal sensor kinase
MFDSVRTRLTLWYAGVLALSLVAFGVLSYYTAARTFYARQDDSLRSTAETVASAYMQELSEEGSAAKANDVVLAQMIYPHRYVEITDAEGRVVAGSSNLDGRTLMIAARVLREAQRRGASYDTQKSLAGERDDDGLRVVAVPLTRAVDQPIGYAVVAESLGVINDDLERLRRDFYAGVPIILVLASLGGYFLARKSLSPIALMDKQTRRITAENLAARLDVPNPHDELGQLAATINQLLARLDAAFNEQQRFVADASHELRTPVAILRGETEVALGRQRSAEEYRDSLRLIGEEAERLSRIVEALFTLTSGAHDAAPPLKERFYLNELVTETARAVQVLASRKGLTLTVGALPEIMLTGDEGLLKQMLLNLLDNAVKYTPQGGEIVLRLEQRDSLALIEVTDNGIGIPLADQAHIFDRFYRVDKARSRAAGGAGLGLAIARWIVEAHGGALSVISATGRGSTFKVTLPST